MDLLERLRSYSKPLLSLRKSSQARLHRLNDHKKPLLEATNSSDAVCNEEKGELAGSKVVSTMLHKEIDKVANMKYARTRLCKEILRMSNDDLSHCSYGPVDWHDPFHLQAIIVGPSGTPFEAGIFFLSIHVPIDYPFKPPKVKFLNKVYHPNVTSDGTIELDILSYNWSPTLTIEKLLLSICSFLSDPNHEQDSCNRVCDLYWNNRKVYDKIAREWTLKYAML